MKRIFVILGGLLGLAMLVGAVAFWWLSPPDPEKILAALERPPSPVLSPVEALATFRIADGFRVELVASEPLVVDPVAMDFDDEGRLYVVEMRGFMRDVEGSGEKRPVGRVVVLEDEDGDGQMDSSRTFVDGLVSPRAIAVLPDGVLIGEPPNLIRCRDTSGDGICDERTRLGKYAAEGTNVEHRENGLLPGLDGWLYNAKSSRRLRFANARQGLDSSPTPFRGQWGIAQDDEGLLYYNHNSGFLYGEIFPGEYVTRQAGTASRPSPGGLNISLGDGEKVWGIRVAPGLNRAYASGTLRADGRQNGPTAVSGVAIQRGDQYGSEYLGDAFVPESGGSAVAHFSVARSGTTLRAEHQLQTDPDWEQREFLASPDERFRPVDAKVGPDGAIWVIDMYRGVIQHAHYVSDYLRDYVEKNDLAAPGAHGRIWRIVREDRDISRRVPSLRTHAERIAALDHPNGWVRDHAQRALIHAADPRTAASLRDLDSTTALGRVHSLWTLSGLSSLELATAAQALADVDPRVRRAGLRTGELSLAAGDSSARWLSLVEGMRVDVDPAVRLQAVHTLGAFVKEKRPLDTLLQLALGGDELIRQAVLSGLGGLEAEALEKSIVTASRNGPSDAGAAWLGELAAGVHRAAQQHADAAERVEALFDQIALASPDAQASMLQAIAQGQRTPGAARVELMRAHALFEDDAERDAAVTAAIAAVRPHITWPGDLRPGGARALSEKEEASRVRGGALYAASCAGCHGANGVGQSSLAPSLVGSPWVRDADDWIVRIALHGLTGPLSIDGEDWNSTMPGHVGDPRFDDAGLASVVTYLRRAWGHGEEPVREETVAEIRSAEAGRRAPWTISELLALPVAHRLDRYVGQYKVPLVPVSLVVERRGSSLVAGRGDGQMAELGELGAHAFSGSGLLMIFEASSDGRIDGASVEFEGTSFPVARVE